MAQIPASSDRQFSADTEIWYSLKCAISNSSGFQRWQLERDTQAIAINFHFICGIILKNFNHRHLPLLTCRKKVSSRTIIFIVIASKAKQSQPLGLLQCVSLQDAVRVRSIPCGFSNGVRNYIV
jgi:hypothetical protein